MKARAFIQALVLVVLLAASWFLLLHRFRQQEPGETPPVQPGPVQSSKQPGRTSPPSGQPVDPSRRMPSQPPEGWREWTAWLEALPPGSERIHGIRELQAVLFSLPADAAVERIMELLASGYDIPTGVRFRIGPEGSIPATGSLRATLLDWLGQLDPEAAARHARDKLNRFGTSLDLEPYVLHLRNFAWGTSTATPVDSEFLERHFLEMLHHPPWLEDPEPAFAEALDIAVYLADPELVPELARLRQPDQPEALRHASDLALERIIETDPYPALRELLDSPEGRALDPRTRAANVARLDPVDDSSRLLLRNYLLDSDTARAEVGQFLAYFPNLNSSLSHNLLSLRNSITNPASPSDRLNRALNLVQAWQADPAFSPYRTELEIARQRLYRQISGQPAP